MPRSRRAYNIHNGSGLHIQTCAHVFGEHREFRPVLCFEFFWQLLQLFGRFPVRLKRHTCIRPNLCGSWEYEKSELMSRQPSSWVPTIVSVFWPIYELRNSIPHLWRQAFQHLSYWCCVMSARYFRPALWYYWLHIQKNKTFRHKNYPTSRNNMNMAVKKLHDDDIVTTDDTDHLLNRQLLQSLTFVRECCELWGVNDIYSIFFRHSVSK